MMGGEIVRAGMGSVMVARMLRLPGAFAAAASLLLSAALLLAPGQARAANECGTPSGTPRTATCTSTHYGSGFTGGIDYQNQNGLTLTVPGGSTAWAITSGTGNWGNGIVLDSTNNGSGGTLTLTVGGASATNNQVAISQRASNPNAGSDNNNGIRVNQQHTGASTTMVTVNAGVTIGGTWAGRMNRRGIDARVYLSGGAASVINHADIFSTWSAIHLERHQSADTTADTTITNSGDLTAAAIVIEMAYRAGDATNTGNAKITNTGTLVKHNSGYHGVIDLEYQGTGNAEVDNKGTLTATHDRASTPAVLTTGYGIRLRYLPNTQASVTGSGTATIKNTHAVMSVNDALRLINQGLGAATIENSGALTTTGTTGDRTGIYLEDRGTTTTATTAVATVTSSGAITANNGIIVNVYNKNIAGDNVGISIAHSGGAITASGGGIKGTIGDNDDTAANNAGDIDIDVTGGSVQSGGTILEAVHFQAGDIDITVSGDVTLASTDQHGIFADMKVGNTAGGVTITNAGEITTPKTGIWVRRLAPTGAGDISVTNSGAIKRTSASGWQGIIINDSGTGDITVTNTGDIGEAELKRSVGIVADKAGTAGDITVTNSGDIMATDYGIYPLDNAGHTGDITVTNSGDITAEHGILVDRLGMGPVTVTNSDGTVLGEKQPGIRAENMADASNVTVTVSGGTIRSDGQSRPAIHARQRGTGDLTVSVSDGAMLISKHNAGLFAPLGNGNKVKVTQDGAILGRKGVYVQVTASATDETVMPRMDSAQPLIDIDWSGRFAAGTDAQTAPNDEGRFAAATAASVVAIAQEVVTEETIRYGSPAGIEAQAISWREVMREVAKGDDPGGIADAAAQMAAVPTGATAASNDYVKQFKAALENDDIAVASTLITAIDTDGTTGVSDADIVTYLQTDDAATRTLLQNILAQSFTDEEKAVLEAVAAGDSAGLTAALDDTGAAFSDDYKMAVRALLDRYNVGNIDIDMTAGSIASRGDGIRAYYATPNDNNGAIDVMIARDASVTGAVAGVYVANAGSMGTGAERILKQTVTVHGTVTGGTDAGVHLVGGGKLTVGAMGKVIAGSSGVGVLVNDPGRSEIVIRGEVRGGAGGRAAVDMTGGGMVTVHPTGRVVAGGATNAIRAAGGATEVLLAYGGEQGNDQGPYRDHVQVQVSGGIMLPEGDGTGVFYAPADAQGMIGLKSDPVRIGPDGMLIVSNLALSPCPEGQVREGEGVCMTPPPDEPQQPGDQGGQQPVTPDEPQQPGDQGGQQPVTPDEPQQPMTPDEPQQPMTPDEPRQPVMTMDCGLASDDRCRLYEALPSALLAMNGLPTYAERASAAHDAGGGWARVEGASGKWKAETSTRPDVAYDHSRYGVRAGLDFLAGGTGRFGLSVHNARGTAEMASVGKIETTGSGVGAHATMLADGFHVDVQAAMTWYDVDLKSALRGRLKDNVSGRGYAVAAEAGRRMSAAAGGVSLTPRAGLAWSKVSLDDFTEEMAIGARVSVADAQSLKGRAGVAVEAGDAGGHLFGSLDVEQEFSPKTEAKASGTALKASAGKTGVRVGVGASLVLGRGASLGGSANLLMGGGGNRDFGAGLNLAVRF